MKISESNLKGVYEIKLDTFTDHRGNYTEIYNYEFLKNFKIKFIQDDISTSRYSVIRGIHGDNSTWKLITCLHGAFYLIVVSFYLISILFYFSFFYYSLLQYSILTLLLHPFLDILHPLN